MNTRNIEELEKEFQAKSLKKIKSNSLLSKIRKVF